MEPHRGRGVLKVGLLAAALLIGLGPSGALALDCPPVGDVAVAVLYETLESPPADAAPMGPIAGTYNVATGERLAEAREAGGIQGCNGLAFMTGSFEFQGQSRVPFDPISFTFGTGTVNGVFQIDTVSGGGVAGKLLDGSVLDLSGLLTTFVAPTSGQWSTLGRNKIGGRFSGVFLLPVPSDRVPSCISSTGWCYTFDPFTGVQKFVPLTDTEIVNGMPLTKAVVTLTN